MIKKVKQTITKDMLIAKAANKYPELIPVFLKNGLSCIGCPFAMQETIEQGAIGHGIDPDKLIKELNSKINKQKKSKENIK